MSHAPDTMLRVRKTRLPKWLNRFDKPTATMPENPAPARKHKPPRMKQRMLPRLVDMKWNHGRKSRRAPAQLAALPYLGLSRKEQELDVYTSVVKYALMAIHHASSAVVVGRWAKHRKWNAFDLKFDFFSCEIFVFENPKYLTEPKDADPENPDR